MLHVGGHLDIVEHLVSLGADVNKVRNDGYTPLRAAAWNGQLDTVKYLISELGTVIDKQDNNGNTALHQAAVNGKAHVVDFLLQDTSQVIL